MNLQNENPNFKDLSHEELRDLCPNFYDLQSVYYGNFEVMDFDFSNDGEMYLFLGQQQENGFYYQATPSKGSYLFSITPVVENKHINILTKETDEFEDILADIDLWVDSSILSAMTDATNKIKEQRLLVD